MIHDIDPPGLEPVSLQSAKQFLRIDHDHEDELIANLITSARVQVENYLSSSLILRRRRYKTTKPNKRLFYLNHYPIKQILSVDTVDAETQTRVAASDYLVNLHARPVSFRWLKTYGHNLDAIIIDFEAGFGLEEDDIPMPIRQAILLIISQNYEYRSAKSDSMRGMPMMADALLMPYKGLRL